jgi:hypothetical protein
MIVPHKGNEALGSAKPDLKENRIPRENKVEALCMVEGRADLHVTTIERFVVHLVFYSQWDRPEQGAGRRIDNSRSFHQPPGKPVWFLVCPLCHTKDLKHEVYITY